MAVPALSIDVEAKVDKFKTGMDSVGAPADKAASDAEARFASLRTPANVSPLRRKAVAS